MGLILDADCESCAYHEPDLRLGATHEQIGQHDVCTRELYAAECCQRVQSVLIYMGQPLPEVACASCGSPLPLRPEQRYRVATLKGVVLDGHPCPRCKAERLSFTRKDSFV